MGSQRVGHDYSSLAQAHRPFPSCVDLGSYFLCVPVSSSVKKKKKGFLFFCFFKAGLLQWLIEIMHVKTLHSAWHIINAIETSGNSLGLSPPLTCADIRVSLWVSFFFFFSARLLSRASQTLPPKFPCRQRRVKNVTLGSQGASSEAAFHELKCLWSLSPIYT